MKYEQLLKYYCFFVLGLSCQCLVFSQVVKNNKVVSEEKYQIVAGESLSDYRVNLLPGKYDIRMLVWVNEGASLRGIKSVILAETPIEVTWDLFGIEKGSWIELKKDFYLTTEVSDALFSIEMQKDFLGVGEGEVYIDDIRIQWNQDYLETDNFSIKTVGETCLDKNNGKIIIEAKSNQNYTANLDGVEFNFMESLEIENLFSGEHNLCISIENLNFEQCYSLQIPQGEKLLSKMGFDKGMATIDIETGTPPYTISLNDEMVLTTSEKQIKLISKHGDEIKISSNVACEGVVHQKLTSEFVIYPNPTEGEFRIYVPSNRVTVFVAIFNSFGKIVWSGTREVENGWISMDLSELSSGVYSGVLTLDKPENFRLIKN